MSRIGIKPLAIPSGVQVQVQARTVKVKGPKGELSRNIHDCVNVKVEGQQVRLQVSDPKDRTQRMHWGSAASHLRSMLGGVSESYEKSLSIEGVGFRAELKGKAIHFTLGFSHPVVFGLPEGVTAQVPQPTQIVLKGADRWILGQAAAQIRALRPAEPYKGKGIFYTGETIRRKEGKKAGK